MENKLIVTASPHIRDNTTTRGLMGNVIVALLPCVLAGALIFGWQSLMVVGVSVAACVIFEWLYCRIMKKPNPVGDLSAVVTGIILGLNLPVAMSEKLWMVLIGAFFAIVIIKQLFGGLGCNFANPALVGRLVLFTGFGSAMTNWSYPAKSLETISGLGVDAAAAATPLQLADAAGNTLLGQYPTMDLLMGVYGGTIGETCALAIILGFGWLVITGTIMPTIPLTYVGSYAVFSLIRHLVIGTADPLMMVLHEVLAGGILFGAVFMASDYVTSPFTVTGELVFGLGLGLITFGIRAFGSMPEGVSYAILFMNLLVPYINELTRQKPLGKKKKAKREGKAA